jgi:hypothetical protein
VPEGFAVGAQANDVEFDYWGKGSAISSDTDKGYAYLTKCPAHVLSSQDKCGPKGDEMVEAYRHIQGHWYLFDRYLPG